MPCIFFSIIKFCFSFFVGNFFSTLHRVIIFWRFNCNYWFECVFVFARCKLQIKMYSIHYISISCRVQCNTHTHKRRMERIHASSCKVNKDTAFLRCCELTLIFLRNLRFTQNSCDMLHLCGKSKTDVHISVFVCVCVCIHTLLMIWTRLTSEFNNVYRKKMWEKYKQNQIKSSIHKQPPFPARK